MIARVLLWVLVWLLVSPMLALVIGTAIYEMGREVNISRKGSAHRLRRNHG